LHQDVRDGLLAVFSSLKLLRGFEPAKLFFVLPANPAVLGTIASGFFSVCEHHVLAVDLSDFVFHRLRIPFLDGSVKKSCRK
jgi:hypothetical protein